jgi:hypothetical protein
LTSDLTNYATLNDSQTLKNKTIQTSSNTSVASFTATTITTSFNHNLQIGDTINFPYIGSMTGIIVSTNYVIASVPTVTTFTMTGITSMGGTVNNAYYVLISRAAANASLSGGSFAITDPSNSANGLHFDVAGGTVPSVIRFAAASGALAATVPSFGGTFLMTNNSQTITGSKVFSLQLANTRAGQTSTANAGFLVQPASTAMTGSNSYFWSYFSTPTTTGSSAGTASTVTIQGAPTVAASNNYAFRIIGGQTSIPSSTVAAPSIVFGTSNTSGFYSSASNIVNCSISGVNLFGISSTGITTSGSVFTSTIRPNSGNQTLLCPNVNAAAGTSQLLISPTTSGWATNGVAELDLGDNNHYIKATNGVGMELNSFNNIKLGTQGSPFRNFRYGTTTYTVSLAAGATATVSVTYGVTLVSVPIIVVSLTTVAGGSIWERCNVGASAVTTTGFDATISNFTASATAGNVLISYVNHKSAIE